MSVKQKNFSRGFTLVELIICMSIITVILPGAYYLHSQVRTNAMINSAQAQMSSDAGQLTTWWRKDLSIARSVALAPEGNAMTLLFADTSGTDRKVTYEVNAKKQIERRLDKPDGLTAEKRLMSDVENLRFVRVGKGFRMEWGIAWSDGIRTLARTGTVLGTPICNMEAGR